RDLAELERVARGDKLTACGQHRYSGPTVHEHRVAAGSCGRSHLGGAQHDSCVEHDVPGTGILARPADVRPGFRHLGDQHDVEPTVGRASLPAGRSARTLSVTGARVLAPATSALRTA